MSGLLRTCGKMMRGCLNNSILSRDIIDQAKKRTSKMLNHIYLETDVEDLIKSRSLSEKTKDVDHAAYSFEQRIKALALEMGENRALTTVDVIISRLEGAWRLQQKFHHDLADQYDTLVLKIRTLARGIGFDSAIASADDVMMIVTNLDQHWRQIQENLRKASGALDLKNTQIQELATFLGVKTPVIESSLFDDIMVRWTEELSKFSDLEKALKEKEKESRLTSEALQNIAKLMGVSYPKNKDALLASITEIWTKSQSKISDLQEDLFQKREQIQRSTEGLQNLAKIFGLVHHPRGDTKKILDDITVKWEESKSLTSQLRTSLLLEKNKNNQAHETLQGLATFMGVETSGCETTMVAGMMDRWMENRREVIDLQRALMEEREKTKQAQEDLQAHLSRPGPVLSSVSVQTDEDQVKSVGPGSLCDKSVQADRSFDIASGGPGPLRKDDSILEATLVNEVTSPTSDCKTQQDVREEVHPYIAEVTRARVSLETIAASAVSAGSSEKDPSRLELSPKEDAKRRSDPKFYQQAKQELQGIKEPLSLSISYRSHSFSSSSSRDLIHLGPRCRSLKTLSAGDAYRPPSRSSLLRGASAIASAINSLQPPPDPSITVTQMTDLIPWAESRCTIKLGSGVAGTVYLFRHAVSKIPVAAKVVDCPGECFDNEVRIHQAISGLPWFPKLYGSFETEDDQAVLAMEFIGGESDDRSYTINDCLDKSFLKTGPDLTRDEWFDVMNDVAQGLKALHSKGFLSNDLKENNVLVAQESGVWRAKIIDLGWASDIATPFFLDLDEDQIEFYESGGGCLHVAPECVSNARPCSTSSDVYSLGRLLASVGRAMGYDDFYFNGMQIYLADEHQRPTVQEVIDKLYKMQLEGGGEDGPGSSSC